MSYDPFALYTPKQYKSLDDAEVAWEERFSTRQPECKSWRDGTLELKDHQIPIAPPPDPVKAPRNIPFGVRAPYQTKIRNKYPNCNHNWYRHGRDRYKRQRYKCSVCGTVGVEIPEENIA